MILHTLNQAPANAACMESALAAIGPSDTLLLIEDGVYWILPAYSEKLSHLEGRLFALKPDLEARGISASDTACVDDGGFVELCVGHDKVVSWF